MKLYRYLLFIFFVMFLMLPFEVDAVSLVQGDTSYGIEKFDLMCNGHAQQSNGIMGITSDNYYVPGLIGNTYLSKVNDKECIPMTPREVLDFYNSDWPANSDLWTNVDEFNKLVYVIQNKYYSRTTYIDASGDVASSDKFYYPLNDGMIDTSGGITFSEGDTVPDGYYKEVLYKFLDSSVLDNNTLSDTEIYVLPDVWVSEVVTRDEVLTAIEADPENALKYRVLVSEDVTHVIKSIPYDPDKFTDIKSNAVEQSPIYNKYTDELLFVYTDLTTGLTSLYNGDAELVGDYYHVYPVTPSLSVAMDNINYLVNTFLDKDYKKLLLDEAISYIVPLKYNNYISYGEYMDSDSNRYAYRLYEYQILSSKEVSYDNNEVSYELTAPVDRVSKIYVNDKELDKVNYSVRDQSVARANNGISTLLFKNEYLNTLKKGTYSVKIEYLDGASNVGTINVVNDPVIAVQPENPNTFDGIGKSIIIGILSLALLGGVFVYFKKQNMISK